MWAGPLFCVVKVKFIDMLGRPIDIDVYVLT